MDDLRSKLSHKIKDLRRDVAAGSGSQVSEGALSLPAPAATDDTLVQSEQQHGAAIPEKPVLGLIQLWPDPELENVANIPTEIDVIAIHGLGGHAFKTWRDGQRMWLRDFLPQDIPTARVLTYGYEAGVAFTQSRSTIRDFATMLLEQIRTLRRKSRDKDRKMIFVCHSLGGIVFKQAMIVAHEKAMRYGGFEQAVAGVIFLGTPHRGSEIVYWSKLLAKFANAFTAGKVREDLLKILEPKSAEMGTICSQFVERGMRLQIFSFFERRDTPGLGSLVVDEHSAILHLPNETPIPMETDHRGLCKFLTGSDLNYRSISNCIEELMDDLRDDSQSQYHDASQRKFILGLRAVDIVPVLGRITSDWTRSSRWFLSLPDFQSWTSPGGQQALWVYGLPGCGKTVLMKSVMSSIMTQSEDTSSSIIRKPIFFFFDDKDPARKTSDALVRSILDQILRDPRCMFVFRYLGSLDKFQMTEDRLWDSLSNIVQSSRGIMFQLVIDAVDEALRHNSRPPTVIDRLQSLLAPDLSGRVRLLLSHRRRPPYEFYEIIGPAEINMDNNYMRQNVYEFVQRKVRGSFEETGLSRATVANIERAIIEKSHGNFLCASLAWEQFSHGTTDWTRDRIQSSLNRLDSASDGLVDFYCRLLSNISKLHRPRVRAAITILRYSSEKVSSRQLAILAVMADLELADEHSDLEELRVQADEFEHYLLGTCRYILKTEDDVVDFVHVTAKDIFATDLDDVDMKSNHRILSQFAVPSSDGHALLYELCMKAIRLESRYTEEWDEYYRAMKRAQRRLRAQFGSTLDAGEIKQLNELVISHVDEMSLTWCLRFALRSWPHHYAANTPDEERDKYILSFLGTPDGYFCYLLWSALPNRDNSQKAMHFTTYDQTHLTADLSAELTLFRVLSLGDYPNLVKTLVHQGVNVNYLSDKINPLSWAVLCQRPKSFATLLRNELTWPNYCSRGAPTALHRAAFCEEDTFYTRKLLEHPDTNVNVVCDVIGTPLHQAILKQNTEAAQLILDHPYVNIWLQNDAKESSYSLAFKNQIWEHLILKMIDMSSRARAPWGQAVSGTSPFLWAGVHAWTDMEERIVRLDPRQVFVVDKETKMNALQRYAFFGLKEKLTWILDRLPPDRVPLRTASDAYDLLHLCANQNWEDVVIRLQKAHGMTSLKSDHRGRNLLHWAIEQCWDLSRFDLASYSISDLNSQDRDGLAPIHLAVLNRSMEALEFLVDAGASYTVKDRSGMSPAHLAAESGWRAAVEYFIDKPWQDFGRSREGTDLLHLVSIWFEGSLVRKLVVSKNALVDVVDRHRRTPLHYASINDNASSMRALIDLGGRIDARDENGMTPLHEAIRCGAIRTARLLLKRGADFTLTDGIGQSCLHLGVRFRHRALVQLFMDEGLSVNAYDRFGMNPLHRACATGNAQHVQMLLEEGASVTARNIHNRSPLDLAVQGANVNAIQVVISWLDFTTMRGQLRQALLDRAQVLAYESELDSISSVLRDAGAIVDPDSVQVRRLYSKEERGSSHWPLIPYQYGGYGYANPFIPPRPYFDSQTYGAPGA